MRRIGHRGAMGHAPENTIASFQKAIDLGCDEVETDVWLLADGSLVVSHDRPASMEDALTLDAVLDFCRGRMGVNVELKCDGGERAARAEGARVGAHLARRGDGSVYISSFSWQALEGARERAPALRRAYLFDSPPPATLVTDARKAGLWGLHPKHLYATDQLLRDARAADLAVQVWTVNDPAEIARFVAMGVDGIMSDFPERIPK